MDEVVFRALLVGMAIGFWGGLSFANWMRRRNP